jgi:hypothetical protein
MSAYLPLSVLSRFLCVHHSISYCTTVLWYYHLILHVCWPSNVGTTYRVAAEPVTSVEKDFHIEGR